MILEIEDKINKVFFQSDEETTICLACDGVVYTRLEFRLIINKCENWLHLNLQEGDLLAIFAHKTAETYALIIACLRQGIVYTCIDPSSPIERLRKIIEVAKPRKIVSFQRTQTIEAEDHPFVVIEKDQLESLDEAQTTNRITNITSSLPAYIMFTSGSTGEPKGVTISRASAEYFSKWANERFSFSKDDVVAQVSPLYFDNSIFDIYGAFLNGCSLASIDTGNSVKPAEIAFAVKKHNCTIWFSVPSLLVYLFRMRALSPTYFGSIRTFAFGGEAFPKATLNEIFNTFSANASFVNVYGPTEGTCICSSYDVSDEDFFDSDSWLPLGTINPNFGYQIMDEQGEPVTTGEVGELWISGDNIALSYFNRPERTAESFINDYSKGYLNRIYKTGDLVKETEDGNLHFLGRNDFQIKKMGYRIELEEIESAACAHQLVSQAACVAISKDNVNRITLFIVLQDDASGHKSHAETMAEFPEFLKSRLPSYMLPDNLEELEVMPYNANGKVDRKQLVSILKEQDSVI